MQKHEHHLFLVWLIFTCVVFFLLILAWHKDLLSHAPAMTCTKYQENPFAAPESMERFANALRKAGLPE